jgi:hypothetical protein
MLRDKLRAQLEEANNALTVQERASGERVTYRDHRDV